MRSQSWTVVVGTCVVGWLAATSVAPAGSAPSGVAGCPSTALPSDAAVSSSERAPNLKNRFGRSVYLILASELSAAGIVPGTSFSGIGWSFNIAPGLSGSNALVVYMENTTDVANGKSTTWSTAISTMTVVHNAATTIPNVTGPFDITFSGGSPFTYTGGGLYIAFDAQYPVGSLSTTTVVWCTSGGLVGGIKGAQSMAAPPVTVAASSFRPETRLTPSIATVVNDASVDYVIAYGAVPHGRVGPQVAQAVVTNRGVNALIDLPVSLLVSGDTSFMDTQLVPSLAACGGQATVTFAPFAADSVGSEVVSVSVPADDEASNDGKSVRMDVTVSRYSFKYPGSSASGGIGFAGLTGAVVAKFTTTSATSVAAVELEFFDASAATYRVAIYADSGSGTPSAPLYVDAADRTVSAAGPVTVILSSAVAVGPGDFFAGIQQTGTTFAGLSYDTEVPVRAGRFYVAAPLPVTEWSDFSPGSDFKLNVGVVLSLCAGSPAACDDLDPCTADACDPLVGCTHSSAGSGPGSTSSMVFSGDKQTLSWGGAPRASVHDVLRGSVANLPVGPGGGDEVCFDDNVGTVSSDATNPPSGTAFWYVVRGENSCGTGGYGQATGGLEETSTTCSPGFSAPITMSRRRGSREGIRARSQGHTVGTRSTGGLPWIRVVP